MYAALCVMLCGIAAGRLLNKWLSIKILGRLSFISILLLLFLLGVSIGGNENLFNSLPYFGWQAGVLSLFCIAGSILCSKAIAPFLRLPDSSSEKKFK